MSRLQKLRAAKGPVAAFEKALGLHRQGRLSAAIALYRKILERQPNDATVLRLLGTAYAQSGQFTDAIERLKTALAHDPHNAETYNNLALAYQGLGQLDCAIEHLRAALALNPKYPEALSNLGDALRASDNFSEAEAVLRQAIAAGQAIAATHNNLGNVLAGRGRIAEAIDCYRQAISLAPGQINAYGNLANALKLLGDHEEAETLYRNALQLNPNNPRVLNNLGALLADSRRPDEALQLLERAIALDGRNAEAMGNLANVYRLLGDRERAKAAYETALQLHPDYPSALCGLGVLHMDDNRLAEAESLFRRAGAVQPEFCEAQTNLGHCLSAQGRHGEALDVYMKALPHAAEDTTLRFHLGVELLRNGRFAAGWREYEWRLRMPANRLVPGPWPRWGGENLEGKTILVRAEQGFGDSLQFIRYLPLLRARAGRLIFECQEELLRLLEGWPSIDQLIALDRRQAPAVHADFQIPLLSLPYALRTTLDGIPAEIPYLHAAPSISGRWRERFAEVRGLKVGLVWAGSPTHVNDRNRSLDLEALRRLRELPDIALFSLQKGPKAEQLRGEPGSEIVDLGESLSDFAETAGAIANLDVIVSVDTSVAHLAGALGKPVLLLLPFNPDWRWLLDRSDSPWYPSMRVFRQRRPGDWKEAVDELCAHLALHRAGQVSPDARTGLEGNADVDDELVVDGVFTDAAGLPCYRLPIPKTALSDPSIDFLRKHETGFGGYEYPSRRFLREHLRPGDVFIDVGAHWGIYALTAATAHPREIHVFAIEPSADNVHHLRHWVETNGFAGQIEIIHAAASAEDGRARLRRDSTMGHRLIAGSDGVGAAEESVITITLTHLLDRYPEIVGKRVFIKIDVEGHERAVLLGAEGLFARCEVAALIWEKGAHYDDPAGQAELESILELLGRKGYTHRRFPHENMGGPLIPFVPNVERCNVFSLSMGFERRPIYEKPGFVHAPPVPRAAVASLELARRAYTERLRAVHGSDGGRWADWEELASGAEERARMATRYIPAGARVLDVGAGVMALRKYVGTANYTPFDLLAHTSETLTGDLNQSQYPEGRYDIAVALELIEYVHDVERLLRHLRKIAGNLVLSYNAGGNDPPAVRRANGWFNDYTAVDLVALLEQTGWHGAQLEAQGGRVYFLAGDVFVGRNEADANAIGGEIARRKQVIAGQATDVERWANEAQLDPAWEARAHMAADFIPAGATVLDLGCGAMSLEKFLPRRCQYLPCDVVRRDTRTLVCDFNTGEYPAKGAATHIAQLGVLEYMYDVVAHLRKLRDYGLPVVVSYCPTDFTAHLDRAALGWVNHLSNAELGAALVQAGFSLRTGQRIDANQMLLSLVPGPKPAQPVQNVLVLSYCNVGNFGDRLGYHLINDVLPPTANITHAHFKPWDVPVDQEYDLIVLGIGNSLFKPVLTTSLLDVLERAPQVVGIFGTQYREEIDQGMLNAVLDRLSIWFARYEEDVLLYGRGRDNVVHLGDWLINAFPMAESSSAEPLRVGDEIWQDLPLDRTIQKIQQHKQVYSTRLHPLLCALTSAEHVAYKEQREAGTLASGKFRSMLLDIFGRTYPEDTLFAVDRDAVMRYKTRVKAITGELRRALAGG